MRLLAAASNEIHRPNMPKCDRIIETLELVWKKIPVIALVGNDAGWTQISREQVPMFGSNVGCELAFSSYETVAIGYGGKGVRLDRENEDKIREIIEDAVKANRNGDSILINALIGKTNFREGSISV